jgi:dynein heavy chain, axonemal
VGAVETQLENYIHNNFERVMSIVDCLKLLRKFKSILHRENLAGSLNSKYQIVFQNYGREIHKVERIYQDQKSGPTLCRNMPPTAGAIAWARHLYKRLAVPME